MTYSQAKIEAYAKLDEAVEALRAVDRDPNVLIGYVLLTCAVELDDDTNESDENVDDMDMTSISGWYSRRGQSPTLSYGIVHEAIRHYNQDQR
jgi:hypothetical protein